MERDYVMKLHFKSKTRLIEEGLYLDYGSSIMPVLRDIHGNLCEAGLSIDHKFGKPVHIGDYANPFTRLFVQFFKPSHAIVSQWEIDHRPEWFEYK
ncbi:MAG: hypothetical protein HC883_00290 [Bdellovibrionaceae bacterium]|nr:hypothetical protein [Pseudobdellovibrionaceae bacterium]